MPTTSRGRKPLPTPVAQTAQIPIYSKPQWSFDGLSALPSPFDTGWGEGYVPDDIRRQMLTHAKVSQATNNLKASILGDGGRVVPCVAPNHPQWEFARELAQACAFGVRHMRGSWHINARQLLDAVHQCHKVAGKTFREQEWGEYKDYWLPDALQILPNHTFQFLRDQTGNVPKLRVRFLANGSSGHRDFVRERFVVLTFRPVDGLIWGTSVFAAAYEGFYKDVQLDPEEMANVAQFGRPTVVVIAPGRDANGQYPRDVPLWNADGTPLNDENGDQRRIPVTEDLANKLEDYEAGCVLVLPGETQFKLAEAQNGGELIARVRETNWRCIASAIMGTDQLTESRNQLSSDNKGIAQDVAGLGVTDGKRALEEMVENDIFTDIVRYNYGESALDYLPIFDLGSGQNARLVGLMNAVAAYVSNGAFDESQWWEYCIQVGLPLPDPDAKKVIPGTSTRGSGGAHGNTSDNPTSNDDAE